MLELLFSYYLNSQTLDSTLESDFLNTPQKAEFSVSPLPNFQEPKTSPYLSAKSYLAIDTKSNIRLLNHNADQQLPMASLTKLMTALIIIENHSLRDIATVAKEATYTPGAKVWLKANEQLTIRNLLKGLLVKSGNDTAIALAIHHSGSVDTFVKEMNIRAKSLGMKNTQFQNPHGLDADNHYSSANDLLLLTQAFWQHKFLRDTVSQKDTTIYSLTEAPRSYPNTNKLLSESIRGVKTGTTDNAGECLILFAEKDRKEVFTIVLGSQSRFTDSQKFLESLWSALK